MKLLLLTEGDAERWDSWSGSAKSVVDHLRLAGHQVVTADVDLYGAARWITAGLEYSPNRKRWGVKYHLGELGYEWRSGHATQAIIRHWGEVDCILQIGATFEPRGRNGLPYVLFCDSNIETSREGAKYSVSDAGWLRPSELHAIHRREMMIYEGASAILTISDWLRRSFIKDFGQHEDRIFTIGAGPNIDLRLVPTPSPEPRSGPPTILFVGKQFERKGGATLLEAFRSVRTRHPNCRLVIVGPPTPPAAEPGIEWLGNLDKNIPEQWAKMASAYCDADVFCLPSLFEPFGIVILEAMYFGLPCIGTDAWAIPEMIVDGQTGLTFPRADADALADRLSRLIADPALARRMGMAGRRRAEERFSWTTVAARMSERLLNCLHVSPR